MRRQKEAGIVKLVKNYHKEILVIFIFVSVFWILLYLDLKNTPNVNPAGSSHRIPIQAGFPLIITVEFAFISMSIMSARVYHHLVDLGIKKIVDDDVIKNSEWLLFNIALGFLIVPLLYIGIKLYFLWGILNLVILFIYSLILLRIPIGELKSYRFHIRYPEILFKRTIYNFFFNPIYIILIGLVLSIIAGCVFR